MAGYKNFGSEVLTADDVNEFLMRQSVVRVPTAAALNAITTPEAGMMAYREDNETTYRHDGSAWRMMWSDTGWLSVPMASSYDAGSMLQYRTRGAQVFVRGRATRDSGDVSGGDVIGTMPAGSRPAYSFSCLCPGAGRSISKILISASSGDLYLSSSPVDATTYVDIDNVSYSAD